MSEDTRASKRGYVQITCPCGTAFDALAYEVARGRGKYCSRACMYKYRKRPSGLAYNLVKENPTKFKPGHVPWTKGTKGATVAWNKGLKGLHLSPATEFKPGQTAGERNSKWAGDGVGYSGLHLRLRRELGRAADYRCVQADETCKGPMHWANVSGAYLGVEDFMPLCQSHHVRYDRARKRKLLRALITGAQGFIAGYLVEELLRRGYQVTGLDDFSKYGRVRKSYDSDPRYRFVEGDARDAGLLGSLLDGCDHFIAGAAMIGGISYFHAYPYDLLAANERITAAAADAAIGAHRDGRLRKVTWLSSSMVYESATEWPSSEGQEREMPPPRSSYGFSKLAVEYFARAARDQYGLPYTIVRPFNCVGVGESRALAGDDILCGNMRLAMSHVVPDLVNKVLRGQDPLHILGSGDQVRHYTYGGDLARGIVTAMEHPDALNEDFNLSTAQATTVAGLADLIWLKIRGPESPLRLAHDEPFEHDVQRRIPDTEKAKRILGFEATTTLDAMLDEVIPWVRSQVEQEAPCPA